jgi:hypothetical protein
VCAPFGATMELHDTQMHATLVANIIAIQARTGFGSLCRLLSCKQPEGSPFGAIGGNSVPSE